MARDASRSDNCRHGGLPAARASRRGLHAARAAQTLPAPRIRCYSSAPAVPGDRHGRQDAGHQGPGLPAADPEDQEGAVRACPRGQRWRCLPPTRARCPISQAFCEATGNPLLEQSEQPASTASSSSTRHKLPLSPSLRESRGEGQHTDPSMCRLPLTLTLSPRRSGEREHRTRGESPMATMKYRVLGHSGMQVSRALPGHHDVRRPDRRGAGAAHHRPRARSRRQLHRHGQRLHRRALGGGDRPRHQGQPRPLGAGHQGGQPDRRGPTDRGLSPRPRAARVEASLRRLQTDHIDLYYIHRSIPTRPGSRSCHLRRPDPPGQDPRVGPLQRARLAHPARPSPVPRSSACRRPPRCSPTTT